MNEIWKDIKGYEGLYQISNLGQVKSLARPINNFNQCCTKDKLLKGGIKRGYRQVILLKDNKRKYASVHRLVAEAFLPNPHNLPIINHKDENKLNNNVSNLEWCSTKYNVNYGNCITKRANSKKKPVQRIDKDGKIYTYLSATDAGKELGINPNFISRCCTGKRKTLYGETWNFI